MRLVPLKSCLNIPEALCIRSMLDAYGIRSTASTLAYAQINWLELFAVGGISIRVAEEDLETAGQLLIPVESYDDCLESESAALNRFPVSGLVISLFAFLYFGTIFPFWVKYRKFSELSD